ncbi:MAG: branched-chain amino acid ABC transporter permease [Deltaproteobacteria bacterium]|nr:branched-chain amino acid ABC transporter permease [Deltaproteobacteria bacterium]MBW1950614.1 branched-chain amino acid ABC transporter permease [Deltaproteobacteria bacterium]RLB36486.1 MAG: branched-chain amino acid ABC transporter permease [Deltaproteobacteria bacterium]
MPLIFLLALLLPWIPLGPSSNYVLRVLTTAVLYMILALGLNIVPGFTGLLDLGYVGFYGIGAYTSGLLAIHYDLSFWWILPLAALNGALWGILLGAPTLRLTGDYFAIVTFGFSELVVLVIRNELWLTRGPMGLPGISPPSLLGHTLTKDWEFFYLVLFLLAVVLFVVTRLEDSRLGRAWFAIRGDEIAAQCCGINLIRYKVTAFAISASIGAMGGAFYAKWFKFIHPDMFKFWESILILCLIVFGGMGSIRGTMLGALVLIPLTEILRAVLPQELFSARYLIYGLTLVLMMRWRPAGLIPFERAQEALARRAEARIRSRRGGEQGP